MKAVVSLNSGSSSIKFAFFTLDDAGHPEHSAGASPHGQEDGPKALPSEFREGEALVERRVGLHFHAERQRISDVFEQHLHREPVARHRER